MLVRFILMILGAVGMLYGLHKYKTKGVAWGRPLAGACGVFALVMALVNLTMTIGGDTQRINSIMEKELRYYDAKMQYLATHLSEAHPGATYLLITNQQTTHNQDRYDVMKAALGSLDIQYEQAVVPAEEAGMMEGVPGEVPMDADMYLTAERFDEIIESYSDVDMVISTLGLPMDYRDMEFWRKKADERPQLVLVDAYVYDLKRAIEKEAIAAVVQYRPDAQYNPDEDVPEGVNEAFDKRYILITPENVAEMDTKYDGLFMEE